MGIFDFLTGGGNSATKPTTPAAPAVQPTDYNSFYSGIANSLNGRSYWDNVATAMRGGARPGAALLSSIGQDHQDVNAFQRSAPAQYDAYLQAQATSRQAQLGQTVGTSAQSANSDVPINPANIAASGPGLTQAFSNALHGGPVSAIGNGQTPWKAPDAVAPAPDLSPPPAPIDASGGATTLPNGLVIPPNGQPMTPGAPTPDTPPPGMTGGQAALLGGTQGNAAPPVTTPAGAPDRLAAQRAFFMSQGRLAAMKGDAAGADAFFKQAQQGAPAGSAVLGNGTVADGGNGAPIGMSGQDFAARGAGKTASAQDNANIAPAAAIAANQAAIDVGKAGAMLPIQQQQEQQKQKAITDATQTITLDPNTGAPVATNLTQALAAHSIPTNDPMVKHALDTHNEQYKTFDDAANAAQTALQETQTIIAAAQGVKTGIWGDKIQNIRKGLDELGLSSLKINDDAKRADIINALGTELAAVRARLATGGSRLPMGTFNIFRSVKSGLANTDVASLGKAMLPDLQSAIDQADFTHQYYGNFKNFFRSDADTAFRASHPTEMYNSQAMPIEPPRNAQGKVDTTKLKPGYGYQAGDGSGHIWTGTRFRPI